MFPYDPQLTAAVEAPPQSIPDVLKTMQFIDETCVDGDGLKWFNWLYFHVTQAVANRIGAGGFNDAAWLSELDVQFAKLYFNALHGYLTGAACLDSWAALFSVRDNVRLARIQFALAGINAHINHDLPEAIVATCAARNTLPQHDTPQYADYTALNTTLDALIDEAKRVLHVRLLGDPLPPVSHLEDILAAWGTSAAREQAWNHAEALWHLRDLPTVANGYLDGLDGLVTFGNKAILTVVPDLV